MNEVEISTRNNAHVSKRGMLIYVIGIIAFVSAAASLLFAAKDFYVLFKAANMDFKSIAFAELVPLGIELAFSTLEVTTGFSLIKQWKAKESIEIHKTVAKLMQVIVYESFVSTLFSEIFSIFVSGAAAISGVNMFYIVAYVFYFLIMSTMSTYVKRNELMKLYYLMMISAFIAVAFSVRETCYSLIEQDLQGMAFGFGNVVLTALISAFALSTVIYYVKNPEKLQKDIEDSEDSELVRETDTHRYLRVYSNRADETGVNVAINVFYVLAVLLGTVAIVFFSIEQNVARFAGGTLAEIINNIRADFKTASVSSATSLLLILYVLLVYPLSYLAVGSGVFLRNSRSKISIVTVSAVGTGIMIISNIFLIVEFLMDFISYGKFDIEEFSVSELALIALLITYSAAQKFRKNKINDLFDGIEKGDSFRSHIKETHSIMLFNGLFSIISLALMFSRGLEAGKTELSYVFFASSVLLSLVAIHLELKHPFAEYVTVKRRKIKTKSESSVESTVD